MRHVLRKTDTDSKASTAAMTQNTNADLESQVRIQKVTRKRHSECNEKQDIRLSKECEVSDVPCLQSKKQRANYSQEADQRACLAFVRHLSDITDREFIELFAELQLTPGYPKS